jgi:hypothetical protein
VFAQKLDGLAELSAPGPVVHLGLVALVTFTAIVLHPPAAGWLVAMLLATLVRPAVYTLAALARDPDPGSAIRAFAFLPFYAIWRIGAAATALGMLGRKPWIRTARAIRPEQRAP